MKRTAFFASAFLFACAVSAFSCRKARDSMPEVSAGKGQTRVVLGDERTDCYLPLLERKRVALFSNQSGIAGDKILIPDAGSGTVTEQYGGFSDPDIPFGYAPSGVPVLYGPHILDVLLSEGVLVTAIFSPEHGFREEADAGSSVQDSVDEKTGVPIFSLYGASSHAFTEERMDAFDTLVVDIQDVGLRYYTYYLSLFRLMDACARHGKAVVILDRPNPNGFYVDGGMLKSGYASGVGKLPLPVVHGMTLGELARMINGEGWLSSGRNACNLSVIPCLSYSHETKYALVKRPSPNLKTMRAVYLYASTCFFERTPVSVGRGTLFPFEVWGSPLLDGVPGYEFTFTPQSMPGAVAPPSLGRVCAGKDLRTLPLSSIWESGCNPAYVKEAYAACVLADASQRTRFWGAPERSGVYWIDCLSGSSDLRTMIETGVSVEDIKASWKAECEAFLIQREPYLLYSK
ncbi:MAG: DUF1343 domain-containing protein [Treponema sp.]|nr:DUF1343 domain-containing protein [Treponema sp.]